MELINGAFGHRHKATEAALKLALQDGELGINDADKSVWIKGYNGVNDFIKLTPALNFRSFTPAADGVTDDAAVLLEAAETAYAAGVGLYIPKGNYKISSLHFNGFENGLLMYGDGFLTKLIFGDGEYGIWLDADRTGSPIPCRKMVFSDMQWSFPEAIDQDCIRLGGSAGTSEAYENTFRNIYAVGKSSSSLQRGLYIENSYINHFYNCYFLQFGTNITFETEANSNHFFGCSVRSQQTNHIRLVHGLSGQQNTFIGGDIENGVELIRNEGCEGLEFHGVYMEKSLNVAGHFMGGLTKITNCLLSEFRFYAYADGAHILENNRIIKTGTSFFLYFVEDTTPYFAWNNNRMYENPANPSLTGLFVRGYLGGFQYTTDGGSSWANATIGSYAQVSQERIYDVNLSAHKRYQMFFGDGVYNAGNGSVVGDLSVSGFGTFSRLGANKLPSAATAYNNYVQEHRLPVTGETSILNGSATIRFGVGNSTASFSYTSRSTGQKSFSASGFSPNLAIPGSTFTVSGVTFTVIRSDGNIIYVVEDVSATASSGTLTSVMYASAKLELTTSEARLRGGVSIGAGGATISKVVKGETTWDPASLADGAAASTTVTVTGAVVGDPAYASLSTIGTGAWLISAQVTAVDTVTVVILNKTGGTVDLGSGTVRVAVTKFA